MLAEISSRVFSKRDGGVSIGIDWRILVEKALLSEKDTKHELLKDFDK